MTADILLFPIRHHSPACAWHVRKLIRERQPRAILIEGPADATPLLPLLAADGTRAPVAIYTTWVDSANELGRPDFDRRNPPRFAAYYPMADYSPELVAVREGLSYGAEVALIDLPFPRMVLAEHGSVEEQTRSLLDERYFRHSRYLQALCEETGARDPDDLWDHLYECDFLDLSTDEFIRRVSTYCALSRADYTPEMLAAEGHPAREAAMAAAIRAVADRADGLVLVVTGGFHTSGLQALLEGETPRPLAKVAVSGDATTVLMRYGFAQLDRLNGYASGMPAPNFYQRVWEALRAGGDAVALTDVVARIVVELGRESRAGGPGLSPADAIAALDQTRRLALFRGHAYPSRSDLLDGITSSFVKGSTDAEGTTILAQTRKLLAGDQIGDLPPEAGVAPLVEDFRRAVASHRIDISSLQGREVTLDLYRSAAHRATSRFFYRLAFLDVPFGKHIRGPDFVAGRGLERTQEAWGYQWTPDTESKLTEQSLYGATLEEAAAARLQALMAGAEDSGQRRADRAADWLLHACRMGLHRFTPALLSRTAARISEDAVFPSLVYTAEQLLLLHLSREPLEAQHLEGVADVALAAYSRACYLLPDLRGTAEPDERQVIDSLNSLQQAALGLRDAGVAASLDLDDLRHTGLRALIEADDGSVAVRGAAAGSLFGDGMLEETTLADMVVGHFEATSFSTDGKPAPLPGPAFLRGLLRTNRACLWQVPALLEGLNDLLKRWGAEQFIRALPELRLAFADLTAHETDTVAHTVADLLGATALPDLVLRGVTEADLLLGATLNSRVATLLARDGLEGGGDEH